MKAITPTVHGYLDYLTVVVFLAAPNLVGFEGLPALLSWTLSGGASGPNAGNGFPVGLASLASFLGSRLDRKNRWANIGSHRVSARFFQQQLGIWLLRIHGIGDTGCRLVDRLFRRGKTSA